MKLESVRQIFGNLHVFPTNAEAFKPKLRVTSFFTLFAQSTDGEVFVPSEQQKDKI